MIMIIIIRPTSFAITKSDGKRFYYNKFIIIMTKDLMIRKYLDDKKFNDLKNSIPSWLKSLMIGLMNSLDD